MPTRANAESDVYSGRVRKPGDQRYIVKMFYPSVYLKSTHSLYRCKFVFFDSVLYSCCYSRPEIPVLKF